uniref:Uncharacterized protein n=1 Tax=Arundo donax TaxID=35708 RepID=A0A0A8YTS7_ARUDO
MNFTVFSYVSNICCSIEKTDSSVKVQLNNHIPTSSRTMLKKQAR